MWGCYVKAVKRMKEICFLNWGKNAEYVINNSIACGNVSKKSIIPDLDKQCGWKQSYKY